MNITTAWTVDQENDAILSFCAVIIELCICVGRRRFPGRSYGTLTVMSKNYPFIIFVIFFVIFILSVNAVCGDLNAFYSKDYKGFWKHWNKVKNDAVSCTDTQKTSLFFSNALETLRNAEVSEANAEEIEKLALKKPECLLQGLSRQTDENQNKFIYFFLINPIYNDRSIIEKSLNSVWNRQKFSNIKDTYYRIKEGS